MTNAAIYLARRETALRRRVSAAAGGREGGREGGLQEEEKAQKIVVTIVRMRRGIRKEGWRWGMSWDGMAWQGLTPMV